MVQGTAIVRVPSIEGGITFERLSFTISYRAREGGDITWFNAECTDSLGTISPKKDIVDPDNDTVSGSVTETGTAA